MCPGRLPSPNESFGNEMLRTLQIVRKVEEFGVITQLLEDIDGFQWLRLSATQQGLDLR